MKTQAATVTADRLRSFLERIERLLEERKAIQDDIRDIFSEAKGVGYDVKTIRWLVQERRIDADTREDVEAREHKIYGGILDDVNWLRHRGWVIHREKGGFRVGNQLIDAQAVVEKAARERRLATLTY